MFAKIKKTKAVIGISDIRLKKKLRNLLSKAMKDDQDREKLIELEILEQQLLNEEQTKGKDKLRKKLQE